MFETEVPDKDIEAAIAGIKEKFEKEEHSFQIVKSAGGYQFLTKPAYQASIGILLKQQSKPASHPIGSSGINRTIRAT